MKLNGAVIIIGSLFWDTIENPVRKQWQQHLSLSRKQHVDLPIRYGRFSSTRSHTYSMVFSNMFISPKEMGKGYVVPLKDSVEQKEDLLKQITLLSRAEGFDKGDGLMFRSWGTVCISINPLIEPEKIHRLETMWLELVAEKRAQLTQTQRFPNVSDFGEPNEDKSIDTGLRLTVKLDRLFRGQLKEVDFLLATSNAIKRSDDKKIYPKPKEIASAMFQANDYIYFLMNRKYSIKTSQDRIVAKILRLKYRVSLKKELKAHDRPQSAEELVVKS